MNSNCAVFGCTITNRYTTMDTKALRQKILDLAIHGKLVPQDPNDEPASVLLERIKAEKERLIKEGKIKRSKKSAKTSDTPHYENVPFEVPSSWVWCRLDDIVSFQGGYAYKSNTYVNQSDWQVIRIGNVKNGIDWKRANEIVEEYYHKRVERCKYCPAIRMCDMCLTAVEYSDEQWDILCHNERVYAQIFMFLYCEMAERGLIK